MIMIIIIKTEKPITKIEEIGIINNKGKNWNKKRNKNEKNDKYKRIEIITIQ